MKLEDLKEGYYWLKNYSQVSEKIVFRIIQVVEVKEPREYRNNWGMQWIPSGIYVYVLGDSQMYRPDYFSSWEQLDFIPLEEPKQ